METVFEQFEDSIQQKETYHIGVWVFLASEVMFFGGMICAYTVYRFLYPDAFEAGCQHMNLGIGTLNTAVLLTSSLTMALAVHEQEHNARAVSRWLWITCMLGLCFVGLKLYEYHEHIQEGLVPGPSFPMASRVQLFFVLYYCITGLHAIHLTIGCGLVGTLAVLARRPLAAFPALGVDMVGLYWHFVDIVWIFLYPMLYLIGHHHGG